MRLSSPKSRAVPVVACGLLIAALVAELVLLEGRWETHHLVGVALIVPGFVAWATARLQLGAAFTTRPEARTLVTCGMYARVRHPIYIAGFIVTTGVLLVVGWTPVYFVLPVLAWHQRRRALSEERVLQDAYGDAYRAYCARTWP